MCCEIIELFFIFQNNYNFLHEIAYLKSINFYFLKAIIYPSNFNPNFSHLKIISLGDCFNNSMNV